MFTNSSLIDYTKLSPHFSKRKNDKIDTITIHCYVGQCSCESAGSWFSSPNSQCSSNYVVDKDGRIALIVEEKNRAWTSGGRDKNGKPISVNGITGALNDHRAVTIEVASDTTHPYKINDRALKSLIELLADICKRNDIKELKWEGKKELVGQIEKQNMTVHRWFANKACPGEYLYNKHFYIAEEVNKLLHSKEEKWKQILREKTDSPDAWIKYIEEKSKCNDIGKWLPLLIEKIAG